jgi:ABC-type amino acid transport substrate-binding protein
LLAAETSAGTRSENGRQAEFFGDDQSLGDEARAVLYRPVEKKLSDLSESTRVIRVLVHYGRTEFFVANGRPYGVEYEAFTAYEKFLNRLARKNKPGISITFIPVRFEELIPSLLQGKGDIAAGFMTITDERRGRVAFTAPYIEDVSEVLVAHSGTDLPKATTSPIVCPRRSRKKGILWTPRPVRLKRYIAK